MATDGPNTSVNISGDQSPAVKRKNILTLVKEWPLNRKIALAAITALSIGLFAFLIIQAHVAHYQLL